MTYGEAFTVQPFNNLVTTQTFTGAQIKTVLEQQRFPGASATPLVLQVSDGFTYTYSPSAAAGSRVSNMALNGTPDRRRGHLPGDDERLPRQRR